MTKYIAKFEGKVVGKRKSHRTYTHAIVVQADADKARDRAYNFVPNNKHDRGEFDYYCKIVACEGKFIEPTGTMWDGRRKDDVGQQLNNWNDGREYVSGYDAKAMADAKKKTADGWDGYVAYLRAEAIARFEQQFANGGFEPRVEAWAGRPDLAQKEASRIAKHYAKVWVVPAEVLP